MILITGGAGYIGSHAVKALVEAGQRVAVFDNFCSGHKAAVDKRALIIEGDLLDPAAIQAAFSQHSISLVMHFAAHSIVPESVENPLLSYRNLSGTVNLLSAMLDAGVNKLVFSSTAAVYGEPVKIPITEEHPLNPTNPYGESKVWVETMLKGLHKTRNLSYISLRYFNAAGADPEGLLGEDHSPETHLIPLVLRTALGLREKIYIFGDDYDTADGTAVRDYIHVADLIQAHMLAMKALRSVESLQGVYNLGHQLGYSVREVIETARRVTGREISCEVTPRRLGDPSTLIASSEKIKTELNWQPRFAELEDMIKTAWAWYQHHPKGYA